MDYSKLRGKIKEVFGSENAFAKAMGKNPTTISAKLNNNSAWTHDEIIKACGLLGIAIEDAYKYFFTQKVGKSQPEG